MISATKIPFALLAVLVICFAGAIQAYASTNPPGSVPSPSTEPTTSTSSSNEDRKGTDSSSPVIFTNILYDVDDDHNYGWDPDSRANTFLINESRVDRLSSTVLVDTHQMGHSICGTDWITDGYFEVYCPLPPPEGAQLRYTVINVGQLQPPIPSVKKEIEERYSNVSKDTVLGPMKCELTNSCTLPGEDSPYYGP